MMGRVLCAFLSGVCFVSALYLSFEWAMWLWGVGGLFLLCAVEGGK